MLDNELDQELEMTITRDQLRTLNVLGAQFVDQGPGLLRARGKARKQKIVFLRMVHALGERVDVVDHCVKHREIGLHRRILGVARERA